MREILKVCPSAKPQSRQSQLIVWVDEAADVDKLLSIETILDKPVTVTCPNPKHFWGIISGVDKGFTEDEIKHDLTFYRVQEVRRETFKKRSEERVDILPSHRVRLLFDGAPPPHVMLCD